MMHGPMNGKFVNITYGKNNNPALECMTICYIIYIIMFLCTVIFHFNSAPYRLSLTTLTCGNSALCTGFKLIKNISLNFNVTKETKSF